MGVFWAILLIVSPFNRRFFLLMKWLLKVCGQSHPVSFVLRPLVENRYTRLVPGMVLLIGILWWATPLSLASGIGGQVSINLNIEPEVTIETRVSTQWPMKEFVLTQGFSFFHSGYDMAASVGTRVNPVMTGVILETAKNWYGYGNMILIDHQNGYLSRYGHLAQIWVKEGQEVNMDTTLGLSGSTGRSTGPHLHLEIMDNGRLVSPKVVLGG